MVKGSKVVSTEFVFEEAAPLQSVGSANLKCSA
jgi:hypothetical protein